jgi:hypothetical protein
LHSRVFSIQFEFLLKLGNALGKLREALICAALCNHSVCVRAGNMLVYWPGWRRLLVTMVPAGDMHVVGEFEVADDHARAADGTAAADPGTAGNADTAGHRRCGRQC